MELKYVPISLLLLCFGYVSCWQFYTSLIDYTLTNSYNESKTVHSEYYFGQCQKDVEDRKLYAHVFLDHIDVVGKLIIRGWLNIFRIPTCILLRATSWPEDTFRSTAYNFQICVPRISYCHSHQRYKYYYYEWYVPEDVVGGMNWDLYFYGPKSYTW